MASRDFNHSRLAADESVTDSGSRGAAESGSTRTERAGRATAGTPPASVASQSPACPDGCRRGPPRAWRRCREASRTRRRRPPLGPPPRLRWVREFRELASAWTEARAAGSAAREEQGATPWWRIARTLQTLCRRRSRRDAYACVAPRTRSIRRRARPRPTHASVHIPENVLSPLLSVTKTTDSS